jgi:hypothetical protein
MCQPKGGIPLHTRDATVKPICPDWPQTGNSTEPLQQRYSWNHSLESPPRASSKLSAGKWPEKLQRAYEIDVRLRRKLGPDSLYSPLRTPSSRVPESQSSRHGETARLPALSGHTDVSICDPKSDWSAQFHHPSVGLRVDTVLGYLVDVNRAWFTRIK